MRKSERKPQLFVIGIDGASWGILNKFLDKLPVFKQLIAEGYASNLTSTIPPVTCPAWKSFSTGLDPEKLRVFWWAHVNFNHGRLKFFNSHSFKFDEIWDYLYRGGYSSLIINLPLTFPPKKVYKAIISGFPASNGDMFTFPSDLKGELVNRFNYKVNPKNHVLLSKEGFLREVYSLIDSRFIILNHMLEKEDFDFINVVLFYTDDIQHYFWYNDAAILKAYQIIDRNLGDILEKYPDSNLLILSDHGFEETLDVFFVNDYFMRRGYLSVERRPSVISQSLYSVGKKILTPLMGRVFSSLTREQQIRLKRMFFYEDEYSLDKIVRISESLVIGLKQGPVFINKAKLKREGISYDQFLQDLLDELRSIRHPIYKKRLVKDFYFPRVKENYAPDFIIIPNEGFDVDSEIISESVLWRSQLTRVKQPCWLAHHNPIGVFIAYGGDIVELVEAEFKEELHIWDVASLILKLYGISLKKSLKEKQAILNLKRKLKL